MAETGKEQEGWTTRQVSESAWHCAERIEVEEVQEGAIGEGRQGEGHQQDSEADDAQDETAPAQAGFKWNLWVAHGGD